MKGSGRHGGGRSILYLPILYLLAVIRRFRRFGLRQILGTHTKAAFSTARYWTLGFGNGQSRWAQRPEAAANVSYFQHSNAVHSLVDGLLGRGSDGYRPPRI